MVITYNNIDYILCSTNGTASASNMYPYESAQMAFDTSLSTKWYSASISSSEYIEYTFENNVACCVTLFSITSANDCPLRDPLKIEVTGSLDKITYTHIHNYDNLLFEKRHQTQLFILPNKIAYSTYRFSIINRGATDGVQVACINLYKKALEPMYSDVHNNLLQQYAELYYKYKTQQEELSDIKKKLDKVLCVFEYIKQL